MSINIVLTNLAEIAHLGVALDVISGCLVEHKSAKPGLANNSSQANSGLLLIFGQLMS